MRLARFAALGLLAAPLAAQEEAPPPPPPAPVTAPAQVIARWPAEEARQGVAVDARYFYAISNHEIGKYDKHSGARVAHWDGPAAQFPHMNSCVADGIELICAASNYPAVPMSSVVEVFDTRTLKHVRSIALPPISGSLTWIERRGTGWFAGFANYDGKGGEPGHDHRWTLVIQLDAEFRPLHSWHFPADTLAAFAPMSNSGGSWGADGLLYITGHDKPEAYAMRLPEAGTVLEHIATVPLPTGGQAFAWDRTQPRVIWGIERATKSVVASRLPAIERR